MSYRPFPEWDTRQKIAMGEKVGRIELFKFLQETACVHIEEREVIAWCHAYKIINPEDKEFNNFLDKIMIPVLIKVGRGRWYRDTITDLSLALSARGKSTQEEDIGEALKEEKVE